MTCFNGLSPRTHWKILIHPTRLFNIIRQCFNSLMICTMQREGLSYFSGVLLNPLASEWRMLLQSRNFCEFCEFELFLRMSISQNFPLFFYIRESLFTQIVIILQEFSMNLMMDNICNFWTNYMFIIQL